MATMTKAQRARSVYEIVFALFTLLVGVLLVVQVWTIYFSADSKPFSVASISTHFNQIQGFIWAWFGGLFVNIAWGIALPVVEKKGKYVDYETQLKKMRSRLPDNGKYALKDEKYSWVRRALMIACGVIVAAGLVVCGYYLIGGYQPKMTEKFFAEHDGAAERLLKILPWLGGALLILIGAAAYDTFLASKEISVVKQFVATEAKAKHGKGAGFKDGLQGAEKEEYERVCAKVSARREKKKAREASAETQKRQQRILWIVRGVLACIGITLFIVGICNGGMTDVFEKAKNICTQCIGLG